MQLSRLVELVAKVRATSKKTEKLLSLEVERDSWTAYVRTELVVEIAFSDLQVSPRYPAGLALRFASGRGYRPDKSATEADALQTMMKIFKEQRE